MPIHIFHKRVLFIAVVLYTLAAINSVGYYHFDEHYQIIEFANLKLGINEPGDLAWEYGARIRPAFQPFIVFILFKVLMVTGVKDAYVLALALRLLTMVLSLTAIALFVRASFKWVYPTYQRVYILLSYFLWFLPFLNVRFMSETWSGLLLLLAVAIILSDVRKRYVHWLLAGLLLGLSFICRFQSAFLILGLYGWLMIVYKIKRVDLLFLTVAAAVAVFVGIGIDTWFYEKLVFTPWNYFQANIIEDVASNFGTSPWYTYILWLWQVPTGILLLISLVIVVWKKPRQLLIWVTLPFIIVHSLIAHKEIRFLFPLINFVPLLLILGWQEIVGWLQRYKDELWRPAVNIVFAVLLVINLIGIAQTTLTPAGNGTKAITHYIHKNYGDREFNLICFPEADPYYPLNGIYLPERFYLDTNVKEISQEQAVMSRDTAVFSVKNNLWVIRKPQMDSPDFLRMKDRYHLKLLTQSIPGWSEWLNGFYNEAGNEGNLLLYAQE